MTEFKLGKAKLRNGNEAFIFEISDHIYGKILNSEWESSDWSLEGDWVENETCHNDLMPNNEPEVIELKDAKVCYATSRQLYINVSANFFRLHDRRWNITFTEVAE